MFIVGLNTSRCPPKIAARPPAIPAIIAAPIAKLVVIPNQSQNHIKTEKAAALAAIIPIVIEAVSRVVDVCLGVQLE